MFMFTTEFQVTQKHNYLLIVNYRPTLIADFKEVFGQHIAARALKKTLGVFYSGKARTKPLVLSFHGTPGTGKNFVADQIVQARYDKGKQSKYVHGYSGRASFPLDSQAQSYSARLLEEILVNVQECPHQTFIFDEVDKMPRGIFEAIVSVLDHNQFFKNVDMSHVMFIFISNLAGVEISERLSWLIRKEGLSREDTDLYHFEKIIEESAYNSEGAFQHSRSIEKAIIDLYIPFMPMEQRHIVLCINRLIARTTRVAQPKILEKVLKSVPFEQSTHMFAESGCKKLEARVDAEMHSEL